MELDLFVSAVSGTAFDAALVYIMKLNMTWFSQFWIFVAKLGVTTGPYFVALYKTKSLWSTDFTA